MRMNRLSVLLACAALIPLAACGKSGGEKEQAAASNAAQPAPSAESAPAAPSGVSRLNPGLWETTHEITDVQVTGAPAGMPQDAFKRAMATTHTVRTCVTPEQAARPQADFFRAEKNGHCKINNMDWSGGRIDVALTCTGANGMGSSDIHMTGQYKADSYVMDGEMVASGTRGMTMHMKTHMTGKRVGDCAS